MASESLLSCISSFCKLRDAAVKYSTFIILGPTKSSGTEDKSFAEKSVNYRSHAVAEDTGYSV